MTTVLGIDPGPTKSAWALLRMPETGKAKVLGCAVVPTAELLACRDLGGLLPDGRHPHLVAVEKPAYVPIGGRKNIGQSISMARQLVETAWEAGGLAAMLRLRYEVVTPTAGQVRRSLLGRPSANDREVKWALEHDVELPKRSNAHVRDAMAVALVGWRMANARQVETVEVAPLRATA